MKTYIEQENGYLLHDGVTYPHNHHSKIHVEVTAGNAEIVAFDHSAKAAQGVIDAERSWRDGELKRADTEIHKAEDVTGAFDAEYWRSYRIALRDWPIHDAFPDSALRPAAPDVG